MGPAAHVTETQALVDFRAMLCTFREEAREALGIIDHEIRRMTSYLDERAHYWHAAIRHADDAMIQARIELNQRRNQRIGDRKPDTSYQEKVLRRAQAELELAQEKLAAVKRWQSQLPHELMNYQGPARQLENALEGQVPRMIAFLEGKINALEAYLQARPPTT